MQNTLQRLRTSKGLTIQQLSKIMRVSVDTISSFENGLLIKIASFFDVTVEYLATGYWSTKDEVELVKIYNSLDDISKGMLIERAFSLAEKSSK